MRLEQRWRRSGECSANRPRATGPPPQRLAKWKTPAGGSGLSAGSAAIVAVGRIGVLIARLSTKNGRNGGCSSHPGPLEEADGRLVASVGDANDPGDRRVLEEKCNYFVYCLGSETLPLRPRGNGKSQFCSLPVAGQARTNITNEPICIAIGNGQLNPLPPWKQDSVAHLFDERECLWVRLGRPTLVATNSFVISVGLEGSQIRAHEPSKHNSVTDARQGIEHRRFQWWLTCRRTCGPRRCTPGRGHVRTRPLERRVGHPGPDVVQGSNSANNQAFHWVTPSERQPNGSFDNPGAPDYWITSSARNMIDCGTVSPSAFAVFKLTTSSNRVGCSTGSSAGFAPLRILSTYVAAIA